MYSLTEWKGQRTGAPERTTLHSIHYEKGIKLGMDVKMIKSIKCEVDLIIRTTGLILRITATGRDSFNDSLFTVPHSGPARKTQNT